MYIVEQLMFLQHFLYIVKIVCTRDVHITSCEGDIYSRVWLLQSKHVAALDLR